MAMLPQQMAMLTKQIAMLPQQMAMLTKQIVMLAHHMTMLPQQMVIIPLAISIWKVLFAERVLNRMVL